MEIKVSYDRNQGGKKMELDENATVKNLLEKMNINPVTVIMSRGNDIILENEILKDKDEIKIMSVISGG
ncbi:MoaD/ThiS family protein [Candidatus Woesearchaeota archaeon]|nr:MoaD/ThiS family protein [Candidatus Woesearchaeota archaeon]